MYVWRPLPRILLQQLQLLDLTSKLEDLQEDQKDNEEYRQKLKKENTTLMTRYLVTTADLIIHVCNRPLYYNEHVHVNVPPRPEVHFCTLVKFVYPGIPILLCTNFCTSVHHQALVIICIGMLIRMCMVSTTWPEQMPILFFDVIFLLYIGWKSVRNNWDSTNTWMRRFSASHRTN